MDYRKVLGPRNIYFLGLCLMMTGLPLSHFLISISQFVLGLAWVMDGGYRQKVRAFLKNRSALLLTGLFVIHLAGLLYTSNYEYAVKDLRIKLPLLVIPFIISTMGPVSPDRLRTLINVFAGSVLAGTLVSMAVLAGIIPRPVKDIREISIFISHIRFSLLICLAIYFLAYRYYTARNQSSTWTKIFLCLLIAWLILFLLILQSVTGIGILIITSLIILVYFAFRQRSIALKAAMLLLVAAIPAATSLYLRQEVKDFYRVHPQYERDLAAYTAQGNRYEHNTEIKHYENGYAIWVYVCWPEMKAAWEKRSSLSFDGMDRKGQSLKHTLLRFLTSKGLRKDMQGVNALSNREIKAVERGITNVNYQGVINFKSRIHMIIWEIDSYMRGSNPSGHSVTQRMEFWRASLGIIKKHLWIGVGTGDVQDAFREEYNRIDSPLSERWRLFSHNQYLTITIALGLLGLLYFLLVLVYPLPGRRRDFIYCIFWLILVISMFTEDTLETQAGVTFYAFFNSFLLFGRDQRRTDW